MSGAIDDRLSRVRCRSSTNINPESGAMILSFILAVMARKSAFSWKPALDLSDNEIRSALIPGVQY